MATNCKNCGVSVYEKPLNRINPIGEIGIWWCENCISKNEPELYKNLKADESKIERDLKEICYGKTKEIFANSKLETTIGTVKNEDLINVIKSLKDQETIRGFNLQMKFKKGYSWAYKILDCLERNSIISAADKSGVRKIIVDNDFFDSEFIILNVEDLD